MSKNRDFSKLGNYITVDANGNPLIQGTISTPSATGGIITTSGAYTIHTFYSGGTFTPSIGLSVDVLVVAGGGGGSTDSGGGGGAGGLLYNTGVAVTATGYSITVGAGGAASSNGSNSTALGYTATGGGAGAGVGNSYTAGNGGSGGGASGGAGGASGGTGVAGQGYAGGGRNTGAPNYPGGGGGGAGAVGGTPANSSAAGGTGGIGVQNSISGTATYYAGGGAGGGVVFGVGGLGGGGNGGVTGTAGTPNTGGGGGAGGVGGAGAGGSGIVIIRYLTSTATSTVNLLTSDSYSNITLPASITIGGATRQSWGSDTHTIDLYGGSSLFTYVNSGALTQRHIALANGVYYDGVNWKYSYTGVKPATLTVGYSGDDALRLYSAPTGIAGNNVTFTQLLGVTNTGAFSFGNITQATSTLITTKALGSTSATYSLRMYKSDGTTDLMFLRDDGLLAVNGSAGGYLTYDRSNSANFSVLYNTSGLIRFYTNVGNSDVATINTTSGAYIAVSDINKKKDFEPYISNALTAIKGLEPTLYRMKGEDELVPKSLWFIAQQVKPFIPEAYVESTSVDSDGNENKFIGINDKAIIAVMVKAIQEQQAQIEELKAKINGQN